MEIKINIRKKYFYLLIALVMLIGSIIFVQGQGASNFGHSATDVNVNAGGLQKTLQQYINDFTAPQLLCTVASRKGNSPLVILGGDASAVLSSGTGSSSSGNALWGIKCVDGYQRMGCTQSSGSADQDFSPSVDSCLGDDEEYDSGNGVITATCCKLG
jgi:hypothetical protein